MKSKKIKISLTLTKTQNDALRRIQRSINALTRQEAIRHLITVDEKVR